LIKKWGIGLLEYWINPNAAKPQPNFAQKIFVKKTKFWGVME